MPHFCECCGADEYLCQRCGRVRCSLHKPSQWRVDITDCDSAGNVCPECVKEWDRTYTVRELGDPAFSVRDRKSKK